MRKAPNTVDHQEWNEQFLPIMWAFVQSYQASKNDFLKKKIKEALKRTIYKWTDLPPKYVSTEIIRLFEENGIEEDPFNLIYTDRKMSGRDEDGKTIMLWEHTTTNHETYQTFVKCQSQEELKEAMSNHTGVCWITREEDNILNKSGFRSNREEGWEAVYEKCGINVIVRNF